LEKLAGALNVNVSHVFELAEQANNSRPTIIRRSEREPIQMGPDSQFKSFLLAPDFQRQMEPVLSRAKPGAISHTTSHEGEEFMILLSGRMRFCFGDEVIELGAGDAAYFDCRVPHRWENIGEDEIEALWVITPPSW
jgi:quercetin dioxygenase-like cupin family protein